MNIQSMPRILNENPSHLFERLTGDLIIFVDEETKFTIYAKWFSLLGGPLPPEAEGTHLAYFIESSK